MNMLPCLIGAEYLGLQSKIELPHEEGEYDLHLFFNKADNTFFAVGANDKCEGMVWKNNLLQTNIFSNEVMVNEVMRYRFGKNWAKDGLTCTLVDVWMHGGYTTGMHRLWQVNTEEMDMDNPHWVADYLFGRFDEESVKDALKQHNYYKA